MGKGNISNEIIWVIYLKNSAANSGDLFEERCNNLSRFKLDSSNYIDLPCHREILSPKE